MKLILRVYLPSQKAQNTKRSTSTWLDVYYAWAKVRNKKSDLERPHESRIGLDFVPKFCPIVFFKFWSIRLIRNRMAFSGNFGKIDPRFYFEVFQRFRFFKISKNFKINLGLFIPNCLQTHAITNTNTLTACFKAFVLHIKYPSDTKMLHTANCRMLKANVNAIRKC